jgi:hypothetical protein
LAVLYLHFAYVPEVGLSLRKLRGGVYLRGLAQERTGIGTVLAIVELMMRHIVWFLGDLEFGILLLRRLLRFPLGQQTAVLYLNWVVANGRSERVDRVADVAIVAHYSLPVEACPCAGVLFNLRPVWLHLLVR